MRCTKVVYVERKDGIVKEGIERTVARVRVRMQKSRKRTRVELGV